MVSAIDDPLSTDAEPAPHPQEHPVAPRRGGRRTRRRRSLSSARAASPGSTSSRPTSRRAQALAERFGWHPLDVEDIVSKRQRPKVDDYEDDGYLFVVLHFPVYDKAIQRLNAAELDVFIGQDYLVTLPNRELLPGHAAVRALRGRRGAPRAALREGLGRPALRGARRPLRLLLPDPRQDRAQARLDRGRHVRGRTPRTSSATSRTSKQEIISYRKVIKPERSTLRVLERRVDRFLPEELELYFDDIVDAAERIWDQLDNYKEVVEALESTNESVISHRQNDVLRVLTIFSVIMLPLTLITGIFGMNVVFPGDDDHRGVLGHPRR